MQIANHGFNVFRQGAMIGARLECGSWRHWKTSLAGNKIRLTSDFRPQDRQLPLVLVQQRQVKGGSKCVMLNGMSF